MVHKGAKFLIEESNADLDKSSEEDEEEAKDYVAPKFDFSKPPGGQFDPKILSAIANINNAVLNNPDLLDT